MPKYYDAHIFFIVIISIMWLILFSNNIKIENNKNIHIKSWQKEDIEYMYNYYFDPEFIALEQEFQKNSQDWVDAYR